MRPGRFAASVAVTLALTGCKTRDTAGPSGTSPSASASAKAPPSASAKAAPSASGAAHPLLTTPNPARAELGVLVRYPDFDRVVPVADRTVLLGCDPAHHLRLRVLDKDLVHGRDVQPDYGCASPTVLGDLIVFGAAGLGGTRAIAVRIPSGEVEPFVPFSQVLHVAGETVLARCDPMPRGRKLTLRILDRDLVHGRDFDTQKECTPMFVLGDAVLYGSEGHHPEYAFHVPSGTLEPYVPAATGPTPVLVQTPPDPDDVVLGRTRYGHRSEQDVPAGDAGDDRDYPGLIGGIAAFDAQTKRPLWHALWGWTTLPVPSEGALLVRMTNTLVELDPATGHVLWERGTPSGQQEIVTLAPVNGADAFALIEAKSSTNAQYEVVIYERGASPEPPWTGKIYGTVTDIGKSGHGRPYKNLGVTVGTHVAMTDAHGKYELTLTTRGTVTVDTEIQLGAGTQVDRKLLELAPERTEYKVDLSVGYFDQACR